MARTLDPTAHALRRDEFVDAAQRLLVLKGYEALSIQELLDEVGASKGAFYHYFDSKQALLEAVAERMADAAVGQMMLVIEDPALGVIEKIRRAFAAIGQWKAQRRELVLAMLQVWLSDDNALFRIKARRLVQDRAGPLLAGLVQEGVDEGIFRTGQPEQVARVWATLITEMNDELSRLFVAGQEGQLGRGEASQTVAAYTDALERVLGAPSGSITIIDDAILDEWFT